MPIYEYKCNKCSLKFEEFRSISDVSQVVCPKCNTSEIQKLVSKPQAPLIKGAYLIKGKGKIDGGIPFGEVPGDHEYTDSRGLKPGEKDYLGPLP
jgi:putative FmdB family regulatory protein